MPCVNDIVQCTYIHISSHVLYISIFSGSHRFQSIPVSYHNHVFLIFIFGNGYTKENLT